MPTFAKVRQLYKDELANRAPGKMAEAGDNFGLQLQGFFFPGNEDAVDQCALAVLREALRADGMAVTETARKRVRSAIGTQTVTNTAVDIVFLTVFAPVRT
ncbi:MAG: hypothetical protein JNL62_07665 [Bryobacterales bacterium]|nr:hypothetical protein [Bryobacterales bacterium]